MTQSKQLTPNTSTKELSEETLRLKHEAENAVSRFFSKFYGKNFDFKLLDIDYLSDKILVDFSSNHTSDDFFQCGRKNTNYTNKIGGQK